jgi:AcrR family transcriptional regulator
MTRTGPASSQPASEPTPGEGRQRLPAARRRTQLLEVALDRFAATGFHGTSMEEIADAAGVTKPVLYQHFGSKRTLFLELLESMGEEMIKAVREGAAAETDPYQRVLAGFTAYFGFVCERTSAFQLLFVSGARLSDEFAGVVRALEDNVASTISGFITADVDRGHRELLGYAIVGLGEVAARFWVSRHEETGYPNLDPAGGKLLAVRLADLVWAGLRGLPGGAG